MNKLKITKHSESQDESSKNGGNKDDKGQEANQMLQPRGAGGPGIGGGGPRG